VTPRYDQRETALGVGERKGAVVIAGDGMPAGYAPASTALAPGSATSAPISDLDPELIDHLVECHRLRMEVARRLRMEARRASTVLPPPNPLLGVTIDDEPPVPLA
jgi:hypothetical protein